MTHRFHDVRTRRTATPWVALLACCITTVLASPSSAHAQSVTAVKVERVKPHKEKQPTLRFLKENKDFIRARFDLLVQKPVNRRGDGEAIDPRFLAYQTMMGDARAAVDSVGAADDLRRRQRLLESITELGDLESRLDEMDRLLSAQRTRLGILQADFTGQQKTALVILLSGYPASLAVNEVVVTIEDADTLHVPLTPEQCESLRQGGVVQVFHGFVEPREQVVQVALVGDAWPGGDSGFITLDPPRDRLTFLRLNLSDLQPAQGGASIQASIWLHDAGTPPGGG